MASITFRLAVVNTVSLSSGLQDVQFYGTGSFDPNGDALTYLWNFGDTNTSTEQNPMHTYAGPGTYVVVLSVSDGKGLFGSASLKITVDLYTSPVIGISTNVIGGEPPLTVTFNLIIDDDTDPLLTFLGDFGDGTVVYPSLSPEMLNTYTTPGEYTVRVRATDSSGAIGFTPEYSIVVFGSGP